MTLKKDPAVQARYHQPGENRTLRIEQCDARVEGTAQAHAFHSVEIRWLCCFDNEIIHVLTRNDASTVVLKPLVAQ